MFRSDSAEMEPMVTDMDRAFQRPIPAKQNKVAAVAIEMFRWSLEK